MHQLQGIYRTFILIYGVSVHVNLTASLLATQYGFSLSQVWVDDNRESPTVFMTNQYRELPSAERLHLTM